MSIIILLWWLHSVDLKRINKLSKDFKNCSYSCCTISDRSILTWSCQNLLNLRLHFQLANKYNMHWRSISIAQLQTRLMNEVKIITNFNDSTQMLVWLNLWFLLLSRENCILLADSQQLWANGLNIYCSGIANCPILNSKWKVLTKSMKAPKPFHSLPPAFIYPPQNTRCSLRYTKY